MLGPGGFGVTYLARDLSFERDVAVKEYFPADFAYREGSTTIRSSTRGTGNDFFEQGKRHFLEEARTLGKFRHEHIVRVLNLFEQFNTAYMVLEFEEGQSLKSWLRTLGRRPTQAELDQIMQPMLSALEVIHSKGMFHRDIAPDNIIIRPTGLPVLIDFGAARNFVREHSHTLGAIVKHGFSPPEQYTLDTKLQGAWSDIYALCATFYLAVMGTAPEEASRRQIVDGMLPIEDHLDSFHRGLYRPSFLAALNAGLALRPKDRPATIAALRQLIDGRDTGVREPSTEGAPRRQSPPVAVATPAPGASLAPRPASQILGPSLRVAPAAAAQIAPDGGDRPQAADVAQPAPAAALAIAGDYPERAARTAGLVALAVAALSAAGFLMIGGVEHPGGLAAALLACAGLVATGVERAVAVARVAAADVGRTAVAASVMSALALGVYWLPLFIWPATVLMALAAGLFGLVAFGRWVAVTLMALASVHLVVSMLLLLLATSTAQKDPYFLPLMALSLAALAGLVLVSGLQIRRRWEPALS